MHQYGATSVSFHSLFDDTFMNFLDSLSPYHWNISRYSCLINVHHAIDVQRHYWKVWFDETARRELAMSGSMPFTERTPILEKETSDH